MERVPLVERVVEVIADCGEAGYRYGSGCIVAGQTVLTAAHVVAGANQAEIRDPNKQTYRATLDEVFVGDADGLGPDLALITVDNLTLDLPAIPLGMVDRESPEADPVERCHAVGYPWFAEGPSPDEVRESVDAYGHVPVLSNLVSGLLSLHVTGPPRPLPRTASLSESEWSGMSGAPMFAAGCLLGVVTEHAPREGPGTITITPLTAIEPDPAHPVWGPGVPDPASWWGRLGIAGSEALRCLPRRRVRPEPAYRSTVREIQGRTHELRDRKREISEIATFVTSSQTYRWLVGGAWTGKTALVAAALAALPEQVDVVSYFLSRREADADSNRFLAAVVPQLADLLDESPPVADRHQFRALWERTCAAAAGDDRHVLLVVDGLDEDLHPPGSPSVAALLPTTVGAHGHVLVSSRPNPELPFDVPLDHPLVSTSRTQLARFKDSKEMAHLALQEVDELKHRNDDGLASDVLAVLTVAGGPLAVEDLAILTTEVSPVPPAHTRRVRRLVTEEAARSLRPVGETADVRYTFAHDSLRKYAETDPDLNDPYYCQRVHDWAQEWAAAGWSAARAAPQYLLEAYPAMLAGDSEQPPDRADLERLARLVTDIGWVDCAIASLDVDTVLASLRTAAKAFSAEARVGLMLRLLEDQAQHFRRATTRNQLGYAASVLGWRALALGADEIVTSTAAWLEGLAVPQLLPVWTTECLSSNLLSVLGRHDAWVDAVAVTRDGLAVSGDQDGTVQVWDPGAPGDPGRELGRTSGAVRALAVTGDGRVITGDTDGGVQLWDSSVPGDPGRELGRHDRPVEALAVTDDGLVVSGDSDGAVWLWDPSVPGDPGRQLGRHHTSLPTGVMVEAIAVTGEGHVISGAYDGSVRSWNPTVPGDPGRELGRHDGTVRAMARSAEGKVISVGDDGAVWSWDPSVPVDPGRQLGRHADWTGMAEAVTHDGQVIFADLFGSLQIWDSSAPGDLGREIGRHDGPVTAATITGNDRIVSGGSDGTVRLWDPGALNALGRRHGSARAGVASTGEGLVVSGDWDGVVWSWDPSRPSDPGRELGRQDGAVLAVAATVDGRVISGGSDGEVWLWDPSLPSDSGRKLGRLDHGVLEVAVSDGLVVCASHGGNLRLWDLSVAGDPGRKLGRDKDRISALAAAGRGQVVCGGDDGVVRLLNLRAPDDPGRELGRHDDRVQAIAAGAYGLVASAAEDGVVRLWDADAPGDLGRELARRAPREGLGVAVTHKGHVICAGEDGTVRLWDGRVPGDPGRELARHDGPVTGLALTGDGHLLVTTIGGDITMFQVTSEVSGASAAIRLAR
jgi:WD40 repeat protein